MTTETFIDPLNFTPAQPTWDSKLPYTVKEKVKLAKIVYEGVYTPNFYGPDAVSNVDLEIALIDSLVRFGLIERGTTDRLNQHKSIRKVNGYRATETGKNLVSGMRAFYPYGCCSFAIQLPCVCAGRTYCPNPEHSSANGCHGSHD